MIKKVQLYIGMFMPEPVTMSAGYFVITGVLTVGGVVTGYFIRQEEEIKRARRQAQLERARQEQQERDRVAREAANTMTMRIGNDADAIIFRMRDKQQNFSELISSLNTVIAGNQHSTGEIQGIINTMQENLKGLIEATDAMSGELAALRDKLKTLTTNLEETSNQLAEKDRMMRDAINSLSSRTEGLSFRTSQSIEELQQQAQEIDLNIPQNTELMTLRSELTKYKQENQLHHRRIAELTEVNQRQSTIIAKLSPSSVSGRFSNDSSPAQQNRPQRPKEGSLFDHSRKPGTNSDSKSAGTVLSSSLPTKFGGTHY